MTQPDGIPVDVEKVVQRAYRRISELTLQLDQLSVLYEDQAAELAQLRQAGATTGPAAP